MIGGVLMGKVNCFAYHGAGACSATNASSCVRLKGKKCVFCKTPEQYDAECEQSVSRIASLDYNKCKYIYEKYCLKNEKPMAQFKAVMDREIKNIL